MPESSEHPLEWIDEYVARLRDYIVVRVEDSLLIKVPNEAYKLNPSGVAMLKRLLDGESVLDFWRAHGESPEVRRDVYTFFVGLKQVLEGCLDEAHLPEAVKSKPFELGFNTLPVLSEVALTYRCNLQCRFCYAGCSCTKGRGDEQEMTTAEVRDVLGIIRHEAGVPSVSFTGGEPTLRKDLAELVRYARTDLGLRVNLITNGTHVDGTLARALKEAGLNSAQVSLESPEESVHDALTQSKGSYRATLRAIRHFQEQGITVHTNTTINRLNLESVEAMPAFVQSLGLERFSMNLVIPAGSTQDEHENVNVRYSEIPELILRIQEESKRVGVEFMWYSPTPVCMFNPIQHGLGNKGCAACDGLLSISPQGDVLPCSSWPEPVGNMLKEDFRGVWDSSRAQWLRRKAFAPEGCGDCEEFALCQGGCPLYWRHFGYGELAEAGAVFEKAAAGSVE